MVSPKRPARKTRGEKLVSSQASTSGWLKDFYINGAICGNDSYYLIVKAICSVGYECNGGSGLLNCRDPFCLNRYSVTP